MTRRGKRIAILSIVLIIALLIFLLFPFSVHIRYEGIVTEYSPVKADIAIPHEISIEGGYYSSILGKDRFRGSFYISDVKGLTKVTNNAHFSFDPRCRYSPTFLDGYGQPHSTEISTLFFDKDFQRLGIQFNYVYTIGNGYRSGSSNDDTSNFIVIGAASREDAISQYSQLLKEKKY